MIFFLFPFAFLPQFLTVFLGKLLGRLAYFAIPKWRKRTFSNLALAKSLNLSPNEIRKLALASFENLGITALEYPKLIFRKNFLPATCENPEEALELLKTNGVIFFCGHQANWELLFLEGTSRMPGVAIGRPIKQKKLYRSIVKMREKYGGTIITPKEAIKEGLRALRAKKFLGIVGDQGMPESDFSSLFLGCRAYTTLAPALLSIKTGAPLLVATIRRVGLRYKIRYSRPIPIEKDPAKMMEKALEIFEASVRENPGQWLWQHNRFKQETPATVYYRYRHDSIALIVEEPAPFLSLFRKIYPRAFITLFTKRPYEGDDFEVILYSKKEELLIEDYRFKLVFNFTDYDLDRHFRKLSAFEVLTKEALKKRSKGGATLEAQIDEVLCRGH